MTTETSIRKVAEKDGVVVRKPRLLVKKTVHGDLMVRLHEKDKRHIPLLYDFLMETGEDVLEKKEEYNAARWILIPRHREVRLRNKFRLVFIKK